MSHPRKVERPGESRLEPIDVGLAEVGTVVRAWVTRALGLAAVVGLLGVVAEINEPGESRISASKRFWKSPAGVRSVAFDRESRRLIIPDDEGGLYCFDLETGRTRPWVERGPALYCVAVSPDGSTVASAGVGGVITLRDATDGQVRSTIRTAECDWTTGDALAETAPSTIRALAYSPDGSTLASGSADGLIRLWDAVDGHPKARLAGHSETINQLAFAASGRILASGSFDGTARIWDAVEGRCLGTHRVPGTRVYGVALSPDERTLAISSGAGPEFNPGAILLLDLGPDRKPTRTLASCSFGWMAFSPDGQTLVAGGGDQVVQFWNVASGQIRATIDGHEGFIDGIAYAPNGRMVATVGRDRLVGLFTVPPPSQGGSKN